MMVSTVPWQHQREAFHFAKEHEGALLGLDMGCGKTLVFLLLLEHWFPTWSKTLILCPKSVVTVWEGEIHKHCIEPPRIYTLGHGPIAKRTETLKQALALHAHTSHSTFIIINYEAAWREPLRSVLLAHQWDVVGLDEGHRIKAPGGKISWLAKALRPHATRRLAMTGTPMPHSPMDIYAQYRFLDPDIFGTSYTAFKARYAIMGGFQNKQPIGWQHMDEFEANLKRIMFRVTAEEVQDLPETIDITRTYTLPPATQKIYDALKDEFCAWLESGVVTASNALVKLLRLQQLTSGYIQTDDDVATGARGEKTQLHQCKAELLADWLEDLPDTEPVVVFCRFTHDVAAVREVFIARGNTCGELSGQANDLAAWQRGELRALAVQIQAGGVGVDFTRAKYCVYYSQTFNLGDYLQSRKRIHRPGQRHTVIYLHLIAANTVDARVYQALEQRLDVITQILEEGL